MWSKWYLALGAVQAGQWALLATLMLSSLLNIAYLLTIPMRAFMKPAQDAKTGAREAPTACLVGMLPPAIACVYLFVYPEPFYGLAVAALRG